MGLKLEGSCNVANSSELSEKTNMADLDDFFAKKDKKKGKTKKFLSSEELVKQLSEQAAKEKELKKPAKIEEEVEGEKAAKQEVIN